MMVLKLLCFCFFIIFYCLSLWKGNRIQVVRQVCSDEAGLTSSQHVSPQLRVQINKVHGLAQAWLWLTWRPTLLKHSSGHDGGPRTKLNGTPVLTGREWVAVLGKAAHGL